MYVYIHVYNIIGVYIYICIQYIYIYIYIDICTYTYNICIYIYIYIYACVVHIYIYIYIIYNVFRRPLPMSCLFGGIRAAAAAVRRRLVMHWVPETPGLGNVGLFRGRSEMQGPYKHVGGEKAHTYQNVTRW